MQEPIELAVIDVPDQFIGIVTEAMGRRKGQMMKMVNHASKEISRIYQRWTSDDVRRYADLAPAP